MFWLFFFQREAKKLVSQYGTDPRGSGSWEGSFTSAQLRTQRREQECLIFPPFQLLASLQKQTRSKARLGLEDKCAHCALRAGVTRPWNGSLEEGYAGTTSWRFLRADRVHLFPTPHPGTSGSLKLATMGLFIAWK